jgi:tRNA(Ile)-lysidine synthase
MTLPGDPLTLDEFAARLAAIGGFEPRPLIAVATSGGPDSLALAILADRWARQQGGEVWALTVDHRLRPESAAEAAQVAVWLAARGIRHRILVWDGAKPSAGIQEAARIARYRLLAEGCVARGCLHLLTAHHREDQAETYWIRRRAKSGADGLAGIAAVRELAGLRLVRPLLGVPRQRLAALLAAAGQQFLSDPSNRNPIFERARLRLDAAADAAAAIAEIHHHAEVRIERETRLAGLLAAAVSVHPAGFAAFDPTPIAAAGELGEAALARIAALVGGALYPLRRERLARLRAGLAAPPPRGRTLGGCRFIPWRGRVLAVRELGRAAPPLSLDAGMSALYDRRFAATLPPAAPRPATIAYLGSAGVAALRRLTQIDNPLPPLVYPTLPAIWDEAGLAAVPHLFYRRPNACILPQLAFRPAAPLFNAGFTVV